MNAARFILGALLIPVFLVVAVVRETRRRAVVRRYVIWKGTQ
jgi:hypothetical protein